MRLKIIVVLSALLLICVSGAIAQFRSNFWKTPGAPPLKTRQINNCAFGPGEKLTFSVSYGIINAGEATLEVKEDLVEIVGRECYHIVSIARSNKVFSLFFKVEDRIDSYLDKEGLFTWESRVRLREGGYTADRYFIFDHYVGTAIKNNKDMTKIPDFCTDALGSFYYTRTQDFNVGDTLYIATYESRKIYDLAVPIVDRDTISTPAGTFDCFVVIPQLLENEAVFKSKGKVKMWLSADQHRFPVKIETEVFFGSIHIVLKDIEYGDISCDSTAVESKIESNPKG